MSSSCRVEALLLFFSSHYPYPSHLPLTNLQVEALLLEPLLARGEVHLEPRPLLVRVRLRVRVRARGDVHFSGRAPSLLLGVRGEASVRVRARARARARVS